MAQRILTNVTPATLRRERALALLGARPFTAAAALRAGLTRDDVRSGAVTKVARGVYVGGSQTVTYGLRAAGLSLLLPPGSHFAGPTAAQLLGLPVPGTERIHVSVPTGAECRLGDLVVRHHTPGTPSRRVWVKEADMPVAVSCDERILQELADQADLVDAVVVADQLLDRSADPDVLRYVWSTTGGAHRAFVQRVARLARAGAESAMESRLRLLLVLGGLPEPVVQHRVVLGGRERRFDLAYPQARIAAEYDGAHHFLSEEQKHADAVRRDAAALADWLVISVVPRGIFRDPAGTLRRVGSACTARGVAFRPSQEWRSHFPQRE